MEEKRKVGRHPGDYERSDEEYANAIIKHCGIVSLVAKELDVHRSTVYGKIARNPEIKTLVDEQREIISEEAESVVKDSIFNDRNVETAKWYLKSAVGTKYNDRLHITGDVNVTTKVDLSGLSGEELNQLEEILRKTTHISTGGSGDM